MVWKFIRYAYLIEPFFFALQCFLFHLIRIYFEKDPIFTVFSLEKSKLFGWWPKYVIELYNFDISGCKIVQIRCMLRKKLSNARWKLVNTA